MLAKTLRWLTTIVLLTVMAGGAGAYWLWTRGDEILRQKILAKLHEALPGWDVEIGPAYFWGRSAHVRDVSLRMPGGRPLASIKEVVATIDRERLLSEQVLDIQNVALRSPELHLTRDAQGVMER